MPLRSHCWRQTHLHIVPYRACPNIPSNWEWDTGRRNLWPAAARRHRLKTNSDFIWARCVQILPLQRLESLLPHIFHSLWSAGESLHWDTPFLCFLISFMSFSLFIFAVAFKALSKEQLVVHFFWTLQFGNSLRGKIYGSSSSVTEDFFPLLQLISKIKRCANSGFSSAGTLNSRTLGLFCDLMLETHYWLLCDVFPLNCNDRYRYTYLCMCTHTHKIQRGWDCVYSRIIIAL